MSNPSARSNRLSHLFVANCALFLCTLVISTVVGLIALHPSSPAKKVPSEVYAKVEKDIQKEVDAKYSDLLLEAKQALEFKDNALEELRGELVTGYVVAKDIEVTDRNQGYWMAEPKLMLGVNTLSGGRLHINFANRSELISVGERIDFRYEDCDCFLLLKSSVFGKADFRFACDQTNLPQLIKQPAHVVTAGLN